MHLRFFVSSPGDVGDERIFARQVIDELSKDPMLRGTITCEAVCWDDPAAPVAMPATLTPQEAVNRGLFKPSDCDVVIVILWSRFGTPLPPEMVRPDGTPYLSGTEWEFEDAINADPPRHTLVYRRKGIPEMGNPADKATFDKRVSQFRNVDDFFKRFRNPDGSLNGGYSEYDSPQEFRDQLRHHLREYIHTRLSSAKGNDQARRNKAVPPYTLITKALSNQQVVPIIGRGASYSGRPADACWDPQTLQFLPSGVELSQFLADDTEFPSDSERDQLAEVASYYEAFHTRAALHERLRQVMAPDTLAHVPVPPLYTFLAQAAAKAPLLIITTNYDTQLEQAFLAAGQPYDIVVYSELKDLGNAVMWWPHGASQPQTPPPNELYIDLKTTTVIFKMHGSIQHDPEWDSFVITESDYVELLARIASKSAIPALFSTHCRDRSLLFLGYSLREWSSRTILQSLNRFFAKRLASLTDDEIQSWAIDERFSELELKFWQKRGVYPFEMGIDRFIEQLRARFLP